MDFRILGPLEVSDGGNAIAVKGRQRALLALLMLHRNEACSVDRIVDELWAQPPPSAHKIVQKYVVQLRHALGDGRLETRPQGYALRLAPDELDAWRFERMLAAGRRRGNASELRAALDLWGGQALEEFRNEGFAQPEIARLETLRVEAREELMEAELAADRGAEIVSEIERLVAEHPLRERPRAQLMLALYHAGRQAEALAAYQDARRTLGELGLEPGLELRELERAILVQDEALAAAPRARPAATELPAARGIWRWAAVAAATVAVAAATIAVLASRDDGAGLPSAAAANAVSIVDLETGRALDPISTGVGPVALAFGGDSVWIANRRDRSISRLDPASHEVTQTIGVDQDVSDVAVGLDSVWVAGGEDGTLSRLDLVTGAVQATASLSEPPVLDTVTGYAPLDQRPPQRVTAVAVGSGSVWVTYGIGHVLRVDPATLVVRARIRVPPVSTGIAAGGGAVWVTSSRGAVTQIHPTSNSTSTWETLGPALAPTVDRRAGIWLVVGGGEGGVWRFDSDLWRTKVERGSAVDISTDDRGAWVLYRDGTIVLLDRNSGRELQRVAVAGSPTAIASGPNALWVSLGARNG